MSQELNVTSEYHTVQGIRLHCATQGPERPPGKGTVVLLHGFPEFWFCWKHQIPALAVDYRVVAPDLRGYNLSDKPAGVENYKMRALVGDLLGLVDALGEAKIHLVAHDWGGAVAWAFAAFHPERLHKLVILNSPHPSLFARELARNLKQQEASQYMNLLRSERAEELLARNDYDMLKRMMFGTMARPERLSDDDRRRYVEAWAQPGAITGGVNFYRAMPKAPPDLRKPEAERRPQEVPATEEPSKFMISVPTLVVWGMKDTALLPSLLEGLEHYVPRLTIHRIADASHWLQHDAAEEVNRAILDFLV